MQRLTAVPGQTTTKAAGRKPQPLCRTIDSPSSGRRDCAAEPTESVGFLHGGWFHLIGNMWIVWILAVRLRIGLADRAISLSIVPVGWSQLAKSSRFNRTWRKKRKQK